MSRISDFVGAARALLWMQVAAAVLATGLGIWALVAVRDLAVERDQLAAEVAELQNAGPRPESGATAQGPAQTPLDTEMRPPAVMPIFFPVVPDPAITPPIPPVDVPPVDNPAAPPATPGTQTPPAVEDCAGPNANRQRCRPGRWSRRDPPVVATPPADGQRQPEAPRPN